MKFICFDAIMRWCFSFRTCIFPCIVWATRLDCYTKHSTKSCSLLGTRDSFAYTDMRTVGFVHLLLRCGLFAAPAIVMRMMRIGFSSLSEMMDKQLVRCSPPCFPATWTLGWWLVVMVWWWCVKSSISVVVDYSPAVACSRDISPVLYISPLFGPNGTVWVWVWVCMCVWLCVDEVSGLRSHICVFVGAFSVLLDGVGFHFMKPNFFEFEFQNFSLAKRRFSLLSVRCEFAFCHCSCLMCWFWCSNLQDLCRLNAGYMPSNWS